MIWTRPSWQQNASIHPYTKEQRAVAEIEPVSCACNALEIEDNTCMGQPLACLNWYETVPAATLEATTLDARVAQTLESCMSILGGSCQSGGSMLRTGISHGRGKRDHSHETKKAREPQFLTGIGFDRAHE